MTNWHRFLILASALGLFVFTLGAGCKENTVTPSSTFIIPTFDQAHALRDLAAQVTFGYRVPGTPDHEKTGKWLIAQLTPYAASVTRQPFSKVINGKYHPDVQYHRQLSRQWRGAARTRAALRALG